MCNLFDDEDSDAGSTWPEKMLIALVWVVGAIILPVLMLFSGLAALILLAVEELVFFWPQGRDRVQGWRMEAFDLLGIFASTFCFLIALALDRPFAFLKGLWSGVSRWWTTKLLPNFRDWRFWNGLAVVFGLATFFVAVFALRVEARPGGLLFWAPVPFIVLFLVSEGMCYITMPEEEKAKRRRARAEAWARFYEKVEYIVHSLAIFENNLAYIWTEKVWPAMLKVFEVPMILAFWLTPLASVIGLAVFSARHDKIIPWWGWLLAVLISLTAISAGSYFSRRMLVRSERQVTTRAAKASRKAHEIAANIFIKSVLGGMTPLDSSYAARTAFLRVMGNLSRIPILFRAGVTEANERFADELQQRLSADIGAAYVYCLGYYRRQCKQAYSGVAVHRASEEFFRTRCVVVGQERAREEKVAFAQLLKKHAALETALAQAVCAFNRARDDGLEPRVAAAGAAAEVYDLLAASTWPKDEARQVADHIMSMLECLNDGIRIGPEDILQAAFGLSPDVDVVFGFSVV